MSPPVAPTITGPQELKVRRRGTTPIQLQPTLSTAEAQRLPGTHLLWVSQSTQCEFPRMFRIDCKAMASLWLVSLDWTYKKTHKCKIWETWEKHTCLLKTSEKMPTDGEQIWQEGNFKQLLLFWYLQEKVPWRRHGEGSPMLRFIGWEWPYEPWRQRHVLGPLWRKRDKPPPGACNWLMYFYCGVPLGVKSKGWKTSVLFIREWSGLIGIVKTNVMIPGQETRAIPSLMLPLKTVAVATTIRH